MSAKLYYTSTSCGAANFISAHIGGVQMDAEQVDIGTKKTGSGADYKGINPKGNVPAIVLPDKTLINENVATLSYIADNATKKKLAPEGGSGKRYEFLSVLAYIASEVHTSVGPFFNPNLQGEAREMALKKLHMKLDYIDQTLLKGGKSFIYGDAFTVADSYLYIILSWFGFLKLDFSKNTNVSKYFEGIKALPEVQAAHARIAENPATIL